METHTIVSQATPMGRSSVAVIRLSGRRSFEIANRLSGTKTKRRHHEVVLLPIKDKKKRKIDSGVFTFFSKPRSYTGEEVVEVSCHGNPFIVKMIIEHSVSLGARIAEPGEYTKRAFLNGKMSLSQAESVALLISSRSEDSAYQNNKNIEDGASQKVRKIKRGLLEVLSMVEYELDVSEDYNTTKQTAIKVSKIIKNNILSCKDLLDSFDVGTAYSNGFRVVIVGRPNVGKSTLMNAVLGQGRSIVSSQAGTTRDSIAHDVIIGGFPVTLVDTAGLRDATNEIEAEGIKRTLDEVGRSDVVLSLFTKDIQPVENIELKNKIDVFTKADLHTTKNQSSSSVSISSITGTGLKKLNGLIKENLSGSNLYSGDVFINTERQRNAIASCRASLNRAIKEITQTPPIFEIAAHEARTAIDSLDSFLGTTTTDEILDGVFSSFCVGK
tara:strand:- start:195 stop:1517 length:1323 start_codon:yes stop_codon:yes gene_type:complete